MGIREAVGAPLEMVFNRPGVAMANLFTDPLNPSTAVRSLFSPESLTPEESKSVAERLGLSGILGGVVNTITDPVVMLSALTSFRFPIPTAIQWTKQAGTGKAVWEAANVWEAGNHIKNAEFRMSGLFHQIRSMHANFWGTKIPRVVDDILLHRGHLQDKALGRFGTAQTKYLKAIGAPVGTSLDEKTRILAFAAAEGLDVENIARLGKKVGPLFKNLPQDEAFKTLVKDFRAGYDMMWDELFGSPENQKSIIEGLKAIAATGSSTKGIRGSVAGGKRLSKIFYDPEASTQDIAAALKRHFKKESGYIPRMPVGTHAEVEAMIGQETQEALLQAMRESTGMKDEVKQEIYNKIMQASTLKQIAKSSYLRTGQALPALDHLKKVEEFLNPEAYAKLRSIHQKQAGAISTAATRNVRIEKLGVTEYSLDLLDTTEKYIHQTSSMYAWTLKGGGQKLMDELILLDRAGDKARASMLRDTYIPLLLGQNTFNQANNMQTWSSSILKWHDKMNEPWAKKLVPKSLRDGIQNMLLDTRGNPSLGPMSRASSGWIYLGALALNPAAAARNLFQLSLTTAPSIGAKWTAVGLERSVKKAAKYFKFRANGMEHAQAFKKAAPAYHRSGIGASPQVEEALGQGLARAWEQGATHAAIPGGKTKIDKAKSAMMAMFSGSEQTVRMVTFEGALAQGMSEGAKAAKKIGAKLRPGQLLDEASRYARKTVQETQFLSGPLNTPKWMADKNPLIRQFTQFSLRYFEFLSHTALRKGAGHKVDIGAFGRFADSIPGLGHVFRGLEKRGYNPGTAARAVLWSEMLGRAGYEALGLDMDESLMSGAAPWPRGYGALAPLPVMPPIASIALAPVLDLAKGEFKETPRILPLLMPGGVAAARALAGITAFPGMEAGQSVARFLQKPYADYSGRTPDGRTPLYTAKGNLIGYATPADLFFKATGLAEKGVNLPNEQALYRMLLGNRDRIREYRSDYIKQVANGNMQAAAKIDKEFQKAIPNVGALKDWVSEDDFKRERKRREITRMEKMLDTLPPQVRPMYAAILQQALLQGAGPEFLGFDDPQALTKGDTARSRERFRKKKKSRRGQGRTPGYRDHMGPLGQEMQQKSTSYGARSQGEPFAQFAGFELDGF